MRIIINLNLSDKLYYFIDESYIERCAIVETLYFDKNKIFEYLKKSKLFIVMLDKTDCVICNKKISHYGTLITDGNWVWSSDLNHYFEKHSFIFPEDFLKSIRDKSYEEPNVSELFCNDLCDRLNFFSKDDLIDFECISLI